MRALAQARATRVTAIDGGAVLLNEAFPLAHDHNVVQLWAPTDAASAADAAETILGGAGVTRHAIEVHDDALAGALEPGLAERGYERSDVDLMRLAGPAPSPNTADRDPAVEVIGIDERVRAGAASWVDEHPDFPDEEVRQLGERIRPVPELLDATFLAIRDGDGTVISYLDLYVRDDIAQLEELYTLRGFRNAGIATRLIDEGLRRAIATEPSIVFLAVDADGGPGRLYERFGFETFGRIATFAKDAAGSAG
jgi:ribosomal protein S18 acetylase RimI-like enzyme